jgi:hypothetical protein
MFLIRKTILVLSQTLLGLMAGSALTACQGEADDVWTPEPGVLDELRVPTALPLSPSGEGGSYAAARAVVGGSASDIEIAIAGGEIELWTTADGLLVVTNLDIEAADVIIGPEVVPPAGVQLTGLRGHLNTPVAVEPTVRGDKITAIAHLTLTVEWALAGDGGAHPLSPLTLDGLPFSIEAERTEFGWSARLVAFQDGRFWAFADLWELADLTLDLYAAD